MKRHEQLLQAHFLDKEEEVINQLRQVYTQSLKDATAKAEKLQKEFDEAAAIYDTIDDEAEKARLQSIMRSKVYQKKYQESLKGQMSDVLDKMHEKSYTTISQYLDECYTDGFVGAMQSLHKQGIPLAMPIDQKAMVRAVQLDSKISKGLYNHLGEDVATLKKRITAEVSRGISSGLTHEQVASNLAARMTGKYENPGGSMAYAMRIARTEGHRIQSEASFDAMIAAKAKGADIVKQWDSTLDGRTRESHQKLDGEIREVEEKFSNGLLYPGDSSGSAAEVVNCRCALMQRAREGLDDGFTKMNNFTKQLESFDSPESYTEFKAAFFSKENVRYMNHVADMEKKYGTKNFVTVLGAMSAVEYAHHSKLLAGNPLFNSDSILTNYGNGDILTTGAYTKLDVKEIPSMDAEQFAAIQQGLKKQGIDVIQDKDGDAYLEFMNSEAMTLSDGSAVIFQSGRIPSASAVFEELIHTTQIRKNGMIKDVGTVQAEIERLTREIEANEKLLKYQKAYKFTEQDVESIKSNLARHKADLKELNG